MVTENEMVGWYHKLNGHELEQILGDSKGQGNLAFRSSWDHGVGHDLVTEQQQSLSLLVSLYAYILLFCC